MTRRKSMILTLMLALLLMLTPMLAGCQSAPPVSTTTVQTTAPAQTTTTAAGSTTAQSSEPAETDALYADLVKLTAVCPNIHHNGVEFAEDDTMVAYFEKLFNCDLTLVKGSTDSINMMIASGEVPDIMWTADNPINDQLYKDLRAANALADFKAVSSDVNAGTYANLEKLTEDEWAKKLFSEDGGETFYALPREYGLYPHAFFVRADWLTKLGLEMPATLDDMYTMLETIVAADPDGKGTTGIVVPGLWALDHIMAGYNGTGYSVGSSFKWCVQDGMYIHSAISEKTREGLRFIQKLYQNNLLDKETFTSSQDIALGKFINGQAAVLIIDFTFGTSVETGLKELYPESVLDVLPPDLAGPNNIARVAASKWYQGVAVSASSVDVNRCFAILDFIMSDEGQDILLNGIEDVHYTKQGDQKFKNIPLFEHENWGLEGLKPMHNLRTLISLKQVFISEYFTNKSIVNNFFSVLATLDDKVARDALLGKPLDSIADAGSACGDAYGKWFADFVMGNKSLDTDWDAYVAEYRAIPGYQAMETEANTKYKP